MSTTYRGKSAERKVQTWLKQAHRITSKLQDYKSPYDLKCRNGARIEVKVADKLLVKGRTTWACNIHRHGTLDESQVDFYVLRLENVPDSKAAIHLVIPAPIGKPTVRVSLRSLLTRYGQYFNALEPVRAWRRKQRKEKAA